MFRTMAYAAAFAALVAPVALAQEAPQPQPMQQMPHMQHMQEMMQGGGVMPGMMGGGMGPRAGMRGGCPMFEAMSSGRMGHGPMGGMAMGGMSMGEGDEGPASMAFRGANMKMHRDMAISYSGNADVDFVKGMIPHHQGAIDMAKTVIAFGSDPEVKKLAEEVIKAQEAEIAMMREWLKKNGQ
jgi:hypothetical protein